MIVDAFFMSYETNAVTVRLAELADVVDAHVIVQGATDFRGNRRTQTVLPVTDRIHPVTVNLVGDDPWLREKSIRDQTLTVAAALYPGATYIVSDGDEIPHPDAIRNLTGPATLPTDLREWVLDYRAPDEHQLYHQPTVATLADYISVGGAHEARATHPFPLAGPRGWHLSTLGTPEMAARKLGTFAHTEYNDGHHDDLRRLTEMRSNLMDYLGRYPLEHTRNVPTTAHLFPHLLSERWLQS